MNYLYFPTTSVV